MAKEISVKKISDVFKCSHCSAEFKAKADNSLNPVRCPKCNSSAVR